MKALAIVALIFTAISFFVPIFGVYISVFTSLLCLFSFRFEPTLSGITVGLNLLKTLFLSPSIVATAALEAATTEGSTEVTSFLYWTLNGFHIFVLVVGIVLASTRKKKDV
tara:strand:+ start:273 stop:605 length:333 start_codon:yes stop_codon:yes gene_type:complete